TSNGRYGIVNFGNFMQGVLSTGGNVSIAAGRDIVDLSVSLPTTFRPDRANQVLLTYGGGDLSVSAGRNILGGDYFVGDGTGQLVAGGRTGASPTARDGQTHAPISTILALQDGQFTVRAQGDIAIGDVINPSYMSIAFDERPFGIDSGVKIESTAGDV